MDFFQDTMMRFDSMRIFSIFSSCMRPILPFCLENNLTRENEISQNLIINSDVMAPPHTPIMLNTQNVINLSNEIKSKVRDINMVDVNYNIAIERNEWPDLDEILDDASGVSEINPPKSDQYEHNQIQVQMIPANASEGFAVFPHPTKPTHVQWTPELHDHFVGVVNQLGGTSKATPEGVLNLMNIEYLTIEHVKSHLQDHLLQKYQTARDRVESSEGGGSEHKSNQMEETGIDDMDVNEALRIQMEVQKQLHEQLEMQRMLQLRIDEQGKYLKMMIQQQQERDNESNKNDEPDPLSMQQD